MKKILLGTTAIIALATFSAEAVAAENISLGLGGFQKIYGGKISRNDTTNTTLDMAAWTNSEVYFTGSTTLDNGITVGARFELEVDGSSGAGSSGDTTDASSMSLASDGMGTVTLGVTTHASDGLAVGGPAIGPIGYGDVDGLAVNGVMTANEHNAFGDKTVKIKWISPDFNGVTVGASWTPGEGFSGASNGKAVTHALGNDGTSIGLAYSGEMSGATVDASINYFSDAGSNTNTTAVGVSVGSSGFTVGGSYNDYDGATVAGATTNNTSGDSWEIGVGYDTGAMSAAANYMSSDQDGTATAGSNSDTMWSVGVGYDLGAGVGLVAEYYTASGDAEGTTASVSSSGFVAGIEVGF